MEYLKTARRLAEHFIEHIPSDGIVPWYACFASHGMETHLVVQGLPRTYSSSTGLIGSYHFCSRSARNVGPGDQLDLQGKMEGYGSSGA